MIEGHICNNIQNYFLMERRTQARMIRFTVGFDSGKHKNKGKYTSSAFAGYNGRPDVFLKNGKPLLIRPTEQPFYDEFANVPGINIVNVNEDDILTNES